MQATLSSLEAALQIAASQGLDSFAIHGHSAGPYSPSEIDALLNSLNEFKEHAFEVYFTFAPYFSGGIHGSVLGSILIRGIADSLEEMNNKVPMPLAVARVLREIVTVSNGPDAMTQPLMEVLEKATGNPAVKSTAISDNQETKAREGLDTLVQKSTERLINLGYGFPQKHVGNLIAAYLNLFGRTPPPGFLQQVPSPIDAAIVNNLYRLAVEIAKKTAGKDGNVDFAPFNAAVERLRDARYEAFTTARRNTGEAVNVLSTVADEFEELYLNLGGDLEYTINHEIIAVAARIADPRIDTRFEAAITRRVGFQYLAKLLDKKRRAETVDTKLKRLPPEKLLQPYFVPLKKLIEDENTYLKVREELGTKIPSYVITEALITVYAALTGGALPSPTEEALGRMRERLSPITRLPGNQPRPQ